MRTGRHCYHGFIRLLSLGIVLFLMSLLIVMTLIYRASTGDARADVDAVLILGAGLDGDTPREVLQERLNASLYYLYDSAVPIVVSGGQGPDETISEAAAMERFLAASGIEPSRIAQEDQSTSTRENIAFSAAIIRHLSSKSQPLVAIISSSFHLFRAKQLAKAYGLIPYGIAARTPRSLLPRYLIREYLAIINDLVLLH